MVLMVSGTVDPLSFTVQDAFSSANKPKTNKTKNILFISLQVQFLYFTIQCPLRNSKLIGGKLAFAFMFFKGFPYQVRFFFNQRQRLLNFFSFMRDVEGHIIVVYNGLLNCKLWLLVISG